MRQRKMLSWNSLKTKFRKAMRMPDAEEALEFLETAGIECVSNPLKYSCTVIENGGKNCCLDMKVSFSKSDLGHLKYPIADWVVVNDQLLIIKCIFCQKTNCSGKCVNVFGPPCESDDNLSNLPQEIKLKIFSYLSVDELCRIVPFVCREWRLLAYDSSLWTNFHRDDVSPVVMAYLFRRSGGVLRVRFNIGRAREGYLLERQQALEIWSRFCPMLSKLDLRTLDQSNATGGVHVLLKNCPKLTKLVLRNVWIDLSAFKEIFSLKQLEVLELRYCNTFPTDFITEHLHCATLSKLHIGRQCHPGEPELIRALQNICPNVKDFSCSSFYQDETLPAILDWQFLGKVCISDRVLPVSSAKILAKSTAMLQNLWFYEAWDVSDIILVIDQHSPLVQNIKIQFVVNNDTALSISKCHALTSLIIDGRGLSDQFLPCIKSLSHLTRLSLRGGQDFSSAALTALFSDGELHNVTHLNLAGCYKVDDRVMTAVLSKCASNLVELDMAWCERVTNGTYAQIVNTCGELQRLDLTNCFIKDGSWTKDIPEKMPHLRELCGAPMCDETLQVLKQRHQEYRQEELDKLYKGMYLLKDT